MSRPRAWVPMPDAESGEFNPFAGFAYEIRALPCQTLARGQTKTPVKVSCILNAILMEHGEEQLAGYRDEVLGWVSDQGTERSISKYPLPCTISMFGKILEMGGMETQAAADVVAPGGFVSRPFFHQAVDV